MTFITLAVTTPVIRQVNEGKEFERQLAIRGASPDLRALIDTANAQNKISVAVCGVFKLAVGDNGAIWGVHQDLGVQDDDFSNLYSLLARRPDISVTFQWKEQPLGQASIASGQHEKAQSYKGEHLTPPPHTAWYAGPHQTIHRILLTYRHPVIIV